MDDYLQQEGSDTIKIEADDAECIHTLSKEAPEEENGSIDELLDVEGEEIIEDDQPVGKLDAPIKIAEDETAEISKTL